jgi:hypothetical protein
MKLPTLSLPAKPDIFKSRKFWTAIIGLMFDVAIAYIPEFEPIRTELILSCTVIVGLVIDGFAREDRAIAAQTGKRNMKYGVTVTAADWEEVAS